LFAFALLTGVHKIRRITDHGPIDAQPLVLVTPPARTLWLVETTREPLQPYIASARHFVEFSACSTYFEHKCFHVFALAVLRNSEKRKRKNIICIDKISRSKSFDEL
jgi:hypothetical protein